MFVRLGTLLPVIGAATLAVACSNSTDVHSQDPVQETGGSGGDGSDLGTPRACSKVDHLDQLMPLQAGVSTLAGDGKAGDTDGCRAMAQFFNPVNVIVGPHGDVFVADFGNGLIRRVTAQGDVTTLVDRPDFLAPFGLAFLPSGDLIVETDGNDRGQRDWGTGTIWRVNTSTGDAKVVGRNLGRPRGIVAIDDHRLVMVDNYKHVISILDLTNGHVSPLAGASGQAGHTDGTGAQARFDHPYDVVMLRDHTLLVADQGNHSIRQVDLNGRVTTWAGTGHPGASNGDRHSATFNGPEALAVARDGTVYVTDFQGYRIRAIAPNGKVSTVAGDGTPGYKDGDPAHARFSGLEGIDVSADGRYLYVADGDRGAETDDYHRIRRVDLDY
jgi:DNA-binding beta-propeller fold protein YncE